MVLLGFADDVMDVPRRYKTILPFIAALPVLAAYSGGTDVRLPLFVKEYIGFNIIHLGPL